MIRTSKYTSLPGHVKNEIALDIMKGIIKPGDKITEEVYAKKLSVSRAPVREAILMLITEGIAHKIENRGTFLKKFTLEEHIDMQALRFFLEQKSLLKIEKIDNLDPLIEELSTHANDMLTMRHNLYEVAYANYHFHYAIVRHSLSSIFIDKYPSFYTAIHYMQQEAYMSSIGSIDKPIEEHHAIVEAIKERDFILAKELLTIHNADVEELLFAHKEENKEFFASNSESAETDNKPSDKEV